MTDQLVLAVPGSLRNASTTRATLEHALTAAAEAGADTAMVDLREYDLPVYDGNAPSAGDSEAFCRRVREADGLLLGTPVYHGTIASPLKAALDYCRFAEFEDTTVGLVATAGGQFPTPALAHMREMCRILHADVLSHQVAVPDASDVIVDGTVVDEQYAGRLAELGERVVAAARQRQAPMPEVGTA